LPKPVEAPSYQPSDPELQSTLSEGLEIEEPCDDPAQQLDPEEAALSEPAAAVTRMDAFEVEVPEEPRGPQPDEGLAHREKFADVVAASRAHPETFDFMLPEPEPVPVLADSLVRRAASLDSTDSALAQAPRAQPDKRERESCCDPFATRDGSSIMTSPAATGCAVVVPGWLLAVLIFL
jgi:hypothetical protein